MKILAPLLSALALLAGSTAHGNGDNFAAATDINLYPLPYNSYAPTGGTAEPGEPAHAGAPALNSRWFKWTATATTACIFREFVNGNASRIAIYTGNSLATLSLVAQGRQNVYFPVTEGVIYHIAIDSPSYDVVQFKPYPAGGADDIEEAEPITGDFPLRVQGNNALATDAKSDEDWHPEFHPTATVWWVWTAPSNGSIRLDARLCDFLPRLTTYERVPGGSPVRNGGGLETVGMSVTAGNDYLFCIDATAEPGQIDLWLEWFPSSPPPNDMIADATDLGSPLIACDGAWFLHATPENGLPDEYVAPWSQDGSVWWKWTAPVSGTYRFSQQGSDGNAYVNVYTGGPGTLTLVYGLQDRNGVRIPVTAGTSYWIQIRDYIKRTFRVELNIHPAHSEPSYFHRFRDQGIFRLYGRDRHPDADPDGDGLSNQIEFACGTRPDVHDAAHPNRPRLVADGSGWRLQWGESNSYTTAIPGSAEPIPGRTIVLTGKTSIDLTGPWTAQPSLPGPGSEQKHIQLPSGPRAFSRLEVHDPNWNPGP